MLNDVSSDKDRKFHLRTRKARLGHVMPGKSWLGNVSSVYAR